jgi:hypothetical protein
MTPNDLQSIYDENQKEAIEILDKLQRNEQVSRWVIFSKRKDLKRILNCEHDYSDDVVWEVDDAIDSARESL